MSALGNFLYLGTVCLFGPVASTIVWATKSMFWIALWGGQLSSLEPAATFLVVPAVTFQIYQDFKACQNSNGVAISREEYSIIWVVLVSLLLASPILAPLLEALDLLG